METYLKTIYDPGYSWDSGEINALKGNVKLNAQNIPSVSHHPCSALVVPLGMTILLCSMFVTKIAQ